MYRCFIKTIIVCLSILVTVNTICPIAYADSRPQVTTNILTAPFGGSPQIIGLALADTAKKHHPWLKFTAAETPGFVYNLQKLENTPSMWDKIIVCSNHPNNFAASKGESPFREKIMGLRALATNSCYWYGIVTFDANIKTIRDLAGKRLALGYPQQVSWSIMPNALLETGYGILDKIKTQYIGQGPSADALIDGKVDACPINFGGNPATNNWIPEPSVVKLLASGRKLYFISWDQEAIDKVESTVGMPMNAHKIPAGTFKGQDRDLVGYMSISGWWVKDVFSEDIAYETVQLLLAQYNKFSEYIALAKSYSPEFFSVGITKRNGHPGAVRAFEEAGIAIPEK